MPEPPGEGDQQRDVEGMLRYVETVKEPGWIMAKQVPDDDHGEECERPVKAELFSGQPDRGQVQPFGDADVEQGVVDDGQLQAGPIESDGDEAGCQRQQPPLVFTQILAHGVNYSPKGSPGGNKLPLLPPTV